MQREKLNPTVLNPVFQIIYNKESLDDDDIPLIADYVVNFNKLYNKEYKEEDETLGDKIFVKYSEINFNQFLKPQV